MQNIQLFSRVSFLDKVFFTKHLSVMIKSGISLTESLSVLINQTKSTAFKKVLNIILKDIENGQSLTKALKKHPKVFDQFYISLIEIGEESGELEKNLDFLSHQLTKDYALSKKIQGAMIYPSIILITAVVIGGAISIFVLPRLATLFQSLEVKLPLSTKILLFIAKTMQNYGILIFAVIIAFIFVFRLIIQTPLIKPAWHKLLLSLPIYGGFLKNIELTSFCRNMGIMLKSGLTITSAFEIEDKGIGNLVFKSYVKRIKKAVNEGKTISSELNSGKYSNIPLIVIKMISVGEKTGKLDEIFLYLGDFFEEEVDDIAKNFSTILEPILLLGMGLIVVFVALSIIMPIYQLTGSLNIKK